MQVAAKEGAGFSLAFSSAYDVPGRLASSFPGGNIQKAAAAEVVQLCFLTPSRGALIRERIHGSAPGGRGVIAQPPEQPSPSKAPAGACATLAAPCEKLRAAQPSVRRRAMAAAGQGREWQRGGQRGGRSFTGEGLGAELQLKVDRRRRPEEEADPGIKATPSRIVAILTCGRRACVRSPLSQGLLGMVVGCVWDPAQAGLWNPPPQ